MWKITLFLIVASILFSLVPDAIQRVCFVDEYQSVSAASNFFTQGEYTVDLNYPLFGMVPENTEGFQKGILYWYMAFSPGFSTGIASNWMSGLGWILGGNILTARLFSIFYILFLLFVIGFLLYRFKYFENLFFSLTCVFFLFLMSIIFVPYVVEGVNHNLGEVSGWLILCLGFLIGLRKTSLGVFILGLCVWHAKFIYLPFAGIFMLYFWLKNKSFSFAMKVLLYFFLPLILWVVLIYFVKGFEQTYQWLWARLTFSLYGSGISTQPVAGLWNRLSHPDLEWVHTLFRAKWRIVFLLIGSPLFLLLAYFFGLKNKYLNKKFLNEQILFLATLFLIYLFSWWYFFKNPFMWVRHAQPAMLVSLSLFVGFFFILFIFLDKSKKYKNLFFSFICLLFMWQTTKLKSIFEWRHNENNSEFFSLSCHNNNEVIMSPEELPHCKCEK